MDLALPHVVIRVCAAGIGPDLIAALGVHPVEVSEARDASEMHRVSGGQPPLLIVVTDPPDVRSVVVDTRGDFPGVPILIVSESAEPFQPATTTPDAWVEAVRSDVPMPDLCWFVLEAVTRAARLPHIAERPLGPYRITIDRQGIVRGTFPASDVAIDAFSRLRPGDALLSSVEPIERNMVAQAIERAHAGGAQFCTVRLLDQHEHRHTVALGIRNLENGQSAVLVQPLLCGGVLVGRHRDNRDPITGLLNRWAISRALEALDGREPTGGQAAMTLVTLDELSAISHSIGSRQTDGILLAAAAALNRVFPYPALTSRLMGDAFLAYVDQAGAEDSLHRAQRLLQALGDIDVPGLGPRFPLRASIGVAEATGGDHDLTLRLAEAAAAEARAAGGNRVIIAGSAEFSSAQSRQLTASMDRGSWELWLQPVVRAGGGRAEYHEALARFDAGHRSLASRADFFTAGRAEGLLERFDRMMLQRAIEMLEAHPDARLSVNVAYETFVSPQFPASFLDIIRRVPDACGRIILEIAPRCVAMPEEMIRPRLESLAAGGVAVALDDFGSGICSLGYLTQWPLAIVKLDQLVTGYVDDDPLQRDFVRTVVSLCRARGITTVAEYTRSEEQLARLVEDGVDLFQGELFGMPRPAAEVLAAFSPASAHA